MFHEGQDDERHGVQIQADADQRQHVVMVEVLHDQCLLQEALQLDWPGIVV